MTTWRELLFPLPVYGERVASAGRREPGVGPCIAPHPAAFAALRRPTSPRKAGRSEERRRSA
jgi:hypothetical protein